MHCFDICDLSNQDFRLQKLLFKSNFLESLGLWPCFHDLMPFSSTYLPTFTERWGAEERFSEFPVWLTLINRPSIISIFSLVFDQVDEVFLESFISQLDFKTVFICLPGLYTFDKLVWKQVFFEHYSLELLRKYLHTI